MKKKNFFNFIFLKKTLFQALSLDQRCIDARSRLPTHDVAIRSQTDRNLKLTGTLRNTSRSALDKTKRPNSNSKNSIKNLFCRFLENSTVVQ